MIALTNGSARPAFARDDIAPMLLKAHREAAPPLPAAPPAPTPAAWRELIGFYREDEYGVAVQIEVQDGALVIVDADDPSECHKLLATEDPLLFTFADGESIGERILFLRNAAGLIAGMNAAGAALHKLEPVER